MSQSRFKDRRYFHYSFWTFFIFNFSAKPRDLSSVDYTRANVSSSNSVPSLCCEISNTLLVWLSRILITRIRKDRPETTDEGVHFSWNQVWQAYRSPHVILVSMALFMTGANLYGLAYFEPSSQSNYNSLIFTSNRSVCFSLSFIYVLTHLLAHISCSRTFRESKPFSDFAVRLIFDQ